MPNELHVPILNCAPMIIYFPIISNVIRYSYILVTHTMTIKTNGPEARADGIFSSAQKSPRSLLEALASC